AWGLLLASLGARGARSAPMGLRPSVQAVCPDTLGTGRRRAWPWLDALPGAAHNVGGSRQLPRAREDRRQTHGRTDGGGGERRGRGRIVTPAVARDLLLPPAHAAGRAGPHESLSSEHG